ncbi:MAG TPA: hypothetical protein VH601_19280 [Bryobacteraceae bacterium]|jgi:hypothetical protein
MEIPLLEYCKPVAVASFRPVLKLESMHLGNRTTMPKKMRHVLVVAFMTTLALNAQDRNQERRELAVKVPETSHLAFVTEYIRQLGAIEDIRASWEQDMAQAKNPNDSITALIHTSTQMRLELRFQIVTLQGMKLKPPFETVIPNIVALYEKKVELYQQIIDIGTAFIGGPKPGVDYGTLAAQMPQIRALIEYIDKGLLEASPAVFMTLIDMRQDSQNHVSHLVITKAERAKLIDNLKRNFGEKLNQKSPNYTVGTASLLNEGFHKDFKCSDEPWQ